MKILGLAIIWFFGLLFSVAIIMNAEKQKPTVIEPIPLYWEREQVQEVCAGKDSCVDGGGKFVFYSIPDSIPSARTYPEILYGEGHIRASKAYDSFMKYPVPDLESTSKNPSAENPQKEL